MYIDLLLLFLILTFAVIGFIRGFVSQMVSLASLVCIILFATPLAAWLKTGSGWQWAQSAPIVVLWGVAAFFIFLLFLAIRGVIHFIQDAAQLSPVDRWLGSGLGLLKGAVLALILSLGFLVLPENLQGRFPEMSSDAKRSHFMGAAETMLSWKSISTFERLHQIQKDLTVPNTLDNLSEGTKEKGQPWASHIEAD